MRQTAIHVLAVPTLMSCVSCTFSAAGDTWQSYTFAADGLREAQGTGGTLLLVRDGYLPIISADRSRPTETPLPAGAGALAGACYLQSSGGKLRDASGHLPLAGIVVEVDGGAGKLTTRTDGGGYLELVLPAGEYAVRVTGMSYRVTVEKGRTSLVALRGGKRMVD